MTSRIGRPSAAKVAAARHRLNPPTAHTAGVAIDADPLQEIPSTLTPDRSWFFNIPDWYDPDGALIQLDPTLKSSRVAAMVAPYGECILNGRAGCWTPPPSQTGYEYAHVGSIVTADGAMLRVANIGGSINHFDTSLPTAASLAADHYANTATRRMVGRYVDNPGVGIMFLGMMYPGTTVMDAFETMCSALSGDWRWIESLGDHEMVGSQLVNNPGFRPVPRRAYTLAHTASLAAAVEVLPQRADWAVSFVEVGAHVASITEQSGCLDAPRVVSRWDGIAVEKGATRGEAFAASIAALEHGAAQLLAHLTKDIPLAPGGDDDGEDWSDELAELDADACPACASHGCEACGMLGYTDTGAQAMAAALGAYTAAPKRPRDGDGDGFVYDSTPRERPFNPATDLGPKQPSLFGDSAGDPDALPFDSGTPKPAPAPKAPKSNTPSAPAPAPKPAPAPPAAEAPRVKPSKATWRKLPNGDWGANIADRNADPRPGDEVTVESRDGRRTKLWLNAESSPGLWSVDKTPPAAPEPDDSDDTPKADSFPLTPEQQAAVDAFHTGEDLLIEAGAGAGKTATLVAIAKKESARKGIYLAFNKALTDEAKTRMPRNVDASTVHSLAFRSMKSKRPALMARMGRDNRKLSRAQEARILGVDHATVDTPMGKKRLADQFLAGWVMEGVRRFAQSADDTPSAKHLPVIEALDADGKRGPNNVKLADAHVAALRRAWADLTSDDGKLRFGHDHYLKAWQLSNPKIDADFLMLDEAQDLSGVMRAIVLGQQDHGVQLGFVGDPAQAIYGFTGATDAMKYLTESGAPKVQLTQSFRFGPEVARVANLVLDKLPDSDLRIVGFDKIDSTIGPIDTDDVDAILTRTNAKAVTLALELMDDGKSVSIADSLKRNVVEFAKAADELQQYGRTGHPELAPFSSWEEVEKFVDEDIAGQELELMVRLVNTFGSDVIQDRLTDTVSEDKADIVLTTAHTSKGREWDRVRIANDFPKRDDEGNPPELSPDEARLLYVAVTRAKQKLDVDAVEWLFDGEDGQPGPVEPVPDVPVASGDVAAAAARGRVSAAVADGGLAPLGLHRGDRVDVERVDDDTARILYRGRSGQVREFDASWDRLTDPGEPLGLTPDEIAEVVPSGDGPLGAVDSIDSIWEIDQGSLFDTGGGSLFTDGSDGQLPFGQAPEPDPEPEPPTPEPEPPAPPAPDPKRKRKGTTFTSPHPDGGPAATRTSKTRSYTNALWVRDSADKQRADDRKLVIDAGKLAADARSDADRSHWSKTRDDAQARLDADAYVDGEWGVYSWAGRPDLAEKEKAKLERRGYTVAVGDAVSDDDGPDGAPGPDAPEPAPPAPPTPEPSPEPAPAPASVEWEDGTPRNVRGRVETPDGVLATQVSIAPGDGDAEITVSHDENGEVVWDRTVPRQPGEDNEAFMGRLKAGVEDAVARLQAGDTPSTPEPEAPTPSPEPAPTPEPEVPDVPESTPDAAPVARLWDNPPTPEAEAGIASMRARAMEVLGSRTWEERVENLRETTLDALKVDLMTLAGTPNNRQRGTGKIASRLAELDGFDLSQGRHPQGFDRLTRGDLADTRLYGGPFDTVGEFIADMDGVDRDLIRSMYWMKVADETNGFHVTAKNALARDNERDIVGDIRQALIDDLAGLDSNARVAAIADWLLANPEVSPEVADVAYATASMQVGREGGDTSNGWDFHEAVAQVKFARWRRDAVRDGQAFEAPTALYDEDEYASGAYAAAGAAPSMARSYNLRLGTAAAADRKHLDATLTEAMAGDVFAAQVDQWGAPGFIFFRKGTRGTAFARTGTSTIGWSKSRQAKAVPRWKESKADLAGRVGLEADVPVSYTHLETLLTVRGELDGVEGYPVAARLRSVRHNVGFTAADVLRHEYGHIVDGRARNIGMRSRERDAFYSHMAANPSIYDEISTYSRTNKAETWAEMFALVTHPRFKDRVGYSDEAEEAFRLFQALIAPVATAGPAPAAP